MTSVAFQGFHQSNHICSHHDCLLSMMVCLTRDDCDSCSQSQSMLTYHCDAISSFVFHFNSELNKIEWFTYNVHSGTPVHQSLYAAVVQTFFTPSTTSTYPVHPSGNMTVSPATHLLLVPSRPEMNMVPSKT